MTRSGEISSFLLRLAVAAFFLAFFVFAAWGAESEGPGDRATGRQGDAARTAPIEIKSIDLGAQLWGRNKLTVVAKNTSSETKRLWFWIGGRYQKTDHPVGFGMELKAPVALAAGEEKAIDLAYYIHPQVGTVAVKVELAMPGSDDRPQEMEPFLTKDYEITFDSPNRRIGDLTSLDEASNSGALKIAPFDIYETKHFVLYASPGTPAHDDFGKIAKTREETLAKICEFLKTPFDGRMNVFFYPDAQSKSACTLHHGDGLAYDMTVVEIYNDKTKVDPNHELTHVVAGTTGRPPAVFCEGLAAYMQEGHRWDGEGVDVTAAKLLKKGRLTPLKALLYRTEIGAQDNDGAIAYPEAASFVGFVMETYGKEKFLALYRQLENGDSGDVPAKNAALIEKVLGASLVDVEARWRERLNGAAGRGE